MIVLLKMNYMIVLLKMRLLKNLP